MHVFIFHKYVYNIEQNQEDIPLLKNICHGINSIRLDINNLLAGKDCIELQ